jgi:hypothetical protein
MAVQWGPKHRVFAGLIAIGVDEIVWLHGHKYLTVVHQIQAKCKRLIWIPTGWTEAAHELVPGAKHHLLGHRRGDEQQGQAHDAPSLRIPDLQSGGSGALPQSW